MLNTEEALAAVLTYSKVHGVLIPSDRERLAEAHAALEAALTLQSHVTVGNGLTVHGTWEAVKRVQTYILLDSDHPVEKKDVRRLLVQDLQAAEAKLHGIEHAVRMAPSLDTNGYYAEKSEIIKAIRKAVPTPVAEMFAVSQDPQTQAQVAETILADGRDPRTGQPLQHTEATYDPMCKCGYCGQRTLKQ